MLQVTNFNQNTLKWASEKFGNDIAERFPKLPEWLSGYAYPTVKQLAELAKAVHLPFGYFFLEKLPDLKTGIPLFRTKELKPTESYSDELRDTISIIQGRQEWLTNYLTSEGAPPLSFVGSFSEQSNAFEVAQSIRKLLNLSDTWANELPDWEKALKYLFDKTEEAGIYVAINGIVENNTHRTLNPEEFRGFVLTDKYAPYIFINGKDFTAAKMFTLAHELAHIWLGKSAAFDLQLMRPSDSPLEMLCNHIAAEFLVPGNILIDKWDEIKNNSDPISATSSLFKVSQLVAARRLCDTGKISTKKFIEFYSRYKENWAISQKVKKSKGKQGGDFYNTQHYRVGNLFFNQVLSAARQGKLLYSDAYKLTGLHGKTFSEFEKGF